MANSIIKGSSLVGPPDTLVRKQTEIIPIKTTKPQNTVNVQTKTIASIYRARVIDAYRNRRIFTVHGNFNTIRRSLLKRGWLEKLAPGQYSKLQNLSEDTLLLHAKRGNDYETVAISKIINHFPAFFIWQPRMQRDLYMDVLPYRNRIRRSQSLDFSTKVGLIGCAEQQHWFRQDGIAGMNYPRFFRLGANLEERLIFIDEFRITQCCNLLRFLIRHYKDYDQIIDSDIGTIPITIVHFALTRVKQQLADWNNMALLDTEQSPVPEEEWANYLESSSNLINNQQKIKCTYRELTEFVKNSKNFITQLEEKYPDLKWDGYKNLWILKPGYESRGVGIVIRNNLNDILQWVMTHSNSRYIAQKYIEQPLLIYKTKFDIRQYMLLFIRESTVQIWLYADCYLRFSSQDYTMDDLRECVHLTNNCVQRKYKNKENRDCRLPKNNMWSLDQFKSYLRTQKVTEEIWEKRVVAGFRENIIAVVMTSLDDTNLHENSFELYGCDFMLDEQYNPIIIEINSTPDLTPSTDITARICPMAMQDLIKVVVDLPRNSRASTGLFKLIYEVDYKFKHSLDNTDSLNISGISMKLYKNVRLPERPKFIKKTKSEKKPQKISVKKEMTKPSMNSKIKIISNNGSKALKASAKEALALCYTMPK